MVYTPTLPVSKLEKVAHARQLVKINLLIQMPKLPKMPNSYLHSPEAKTNTSARCLPHTFNRNFFANFLKISPSISLQTQRVIIISNNKSLS